MPNPCSMMLSLINRLKTVHSLYGIQGTRMQDLMVLRGEKIATFLSLSPPPPASQYQISSPTHSTRVNDLRPQLLSIASVDLMESLIVDQPSQQCWYHDLPWKTFWVKLELSVNYETILWETVIQVPKGTETRKSPTLYNLIAVSMQHEQDLFWKEI